MEKRTSLFENGLIWFGAGVSLAEILTGTSFSSLGFGRGLAAILLGHMIGCVLLFLSGVIGGRQRLSAMETVRGSFGSRGTVFFALLNVLQLLGWTAIMIYDGALAAGGIFSIGHWVWCLVIGGLIILWVLIGITNLGKLNTFAMAALFLLTLILCKVIFFGGSAAVTLPDDSLTFGAAVELAVAMPLSWLPLISDYTREAEKPVKAAAVSAIIYGLVSCWMYIIGMGAAMRTGADHAESRSGHCRTSDHHLLHGDHHIFGCRFRRDLLRVHLKKDTGKVCGHCSCPTWHHWCHRLPYGRHHRVPLSDWVGICPHDRNSDRRLFSSAPKQQS